MWPALLSFLGGPIVNGAVKAYTAKLQAGTTHDQLTIDLATRELAVQQAELEADAKIKVAEVGHWSEPDHLFAYVTLLFYTKCLIWDMALGLGTTDAPKGVVAVWGGMVMTYWFAKRGAESLVRILKR